MRAFEATGSGSFLLTDRAYGIEKMFNVRDELVLYYDVDGLIKSVRYFFEHARRRKRNFRQSAKRANQLFADEVVKGTARSFYGWVSGLTTRDEGQKLSIESLLNS